MALTYNEPVVFAEYAMDTAAACQKAGIQVVAVTAGYISEQARPDFFKDVDAANVDLKSFNDDFYKEICGGSLQPVLDTMVYIRHKTNIWLEVTNLLIPTLNDDIKQIRKMCQWLVAELGNDVPLHFSAFHPNHQMQKLQPTPLELLIEARNIALESGLRYVYTGNVQYEEGSNTYCPNCKQILIERTVFQVRKNALKNGCCPHCNFQIAGKWHG